MKKLDIYPMEKYSDNFFNIAPAKDFIPEWYRISKSKIKNTNTELYPNLFTVTTATYKKCMPFFDAMTSGYIVYLTADIEVSDTPDNKKQIHWRTEREIVTTHSEEQWDGMPVPDQYIPFVFKWHNQLSIKTPKNYSALFMHPSNRFDLPFRTISGIVDTDNYDLQIHFPFFIHKDFNGIIESGTPIVQIIPIKRESWSRNHKKYVEDRKHINFEKFVSTIKRSYKNNHWIKKEYH
jgi:hypothetical protein